MITFGATKVVWIEPQPPTLEAVVEQPDVLLGYWWKPTEPVEIDVSEHVVNIDIRLEGSDV